MAIKKIYEYVVELEKKNVRYKRILEYYADEANYEDLGHGEHSITYDGGEYARKALKEDCENGE